MGKAPNRAIVRGMFAGMAAAAGVAVLVRQLGYEFLSVGAGILTACVVSGGVAYWFRERPPRGPDPAP